MTRRGLVISWSVGILVLLTIFYFFLWYMFLPEHLAKGANPEQIAKLKRILWYAAGGFAVVYWSAVHFFDWRRLVRDEKKEAADEARISEALSSGRMREVFIKNETELKKMTKLLKAKEHEVTSFWSESIRCYVLVTDASSELINQAYIFMALD